MTTFAEPASRDAAPQTAEPLGVFRTIATEFGLIRPGDPLDQKIVDAFAALMDKAASIGQEYETDAGNAGEHIRAVLYPC